MIHEIERLKPRREVALLKDGEMVPLQVRGVAIVEDRAILLLQAADEAPADYGLTCEVCCLPARQTGGAYPFVTGEVVHADTGRVECGPLDHLAELPIPGGSARPNRAVAARLVEGSPALLPPAP